MSPLIPLQGPFWHTVKRASMPDEHCETSAMPPREGLRLNHLNRTQKAGPKPGDPYEQARDHCQAIGDEVEPAAERCSR